MARATKEDGWGWANDMSVAMDTRGLIWANLSGGRCAIWVASVDLPQQQEMRNRKTVSPSRVSDEKVLERALSSDVCGFNPITRSFRSAAAALGWNEKLTEASFNRARNTEFKARFECLLGS